MSPLVAEIYGPDEAGRQQLAQRVAKAFGQTADIVGIDTSLREDAPRAHLTVRRQRAESLGIPVAAIAQTVHAALSGGDAAYLHDGQSKYPVPVRLQLPRDAQVGLDALLALPMRSQRPDGAAVRTGQVDRGVIDKPLFTKDHAAPELRVRRHGRQARLPAVRAVRDRPHLDEAALTNTGELGEYWIRQPSDAWRSTPSSGTASGRSPTRPSATWAPPTAWA
jgi:hypothetical protein